MSDEKALLGAIWEHPHEDTPRVVYADWLQETGDPANVAWAEFIRLQCQYELLDGDDPQFLPKQKAARKLLKKWEDHWWLRLPHAKEMKWWYTQPWRDELDYWYRGFPRPLEDTHIQFEQLFSLPESEMRAVPTRSFMTNYTLSRLDDLLAWQHLDRLDTLTIHCGDVHPADWVDRVLACPGMRNVCRIRLTSSPTRDHTGELESLLNGWRNRRIVELCLDNVRIGNAGFRMLVNHPVMAGVRRFEARVIDLTAPGMRGLAESSYRPPIPELRLSCNYQLGDAGVAALIRWPGLSRIRDLYLEMCGIGDRGVAALAGCNRAANLRTLRLGGTGSVRMGREPSPPHPTSET